MLRAWLQGGWPGIEIVAINDIAPAETCAYLLEFDSVFGPLEGVSLDGDTMVVQGRRLPLTRSADLSTLDVRGIDLVGTPFVAFSNLIAAGDTPEVFNGTCGAERIGRAHV